MLSEDEPRGRAFSHGETILAPPAPLRIKYVPLSPPAGARSPPPGARAAPPPLTKIEPRDATAADIELLHSRELIETVRATAEKGGAWLDPDTYVAPRSYDAALRAAGGLLAATDAVLDGEVASAFCLVRPPGHHATPTRAMGFCLFNSVALAAAHALDRRGLERVAIIDFDVHHGNGTQDAFYFDPRVLYVSSHQYPFYPGSGYWAETGEGAGQGATVNLPTPRGG